MTLDRRTLLELAASGAILGAGGASAQTAGPASSSALPAGLPEPLETIPLWPKGVPGIPAKLIAESVVERSTDAQLTDRAMQHVASPRMAVFRPLRPNGAAVLITPGGGYRWVVVDKEGYELGRWLAARGFTAFVLFYRLPGDGWAAGPDVALSDAQRAMRLIRHRVPDWFRDAKFGIWAHWSAQCVPEYGDWYGRQMYLQGNPFYEHHLKHYGHPADRGFLEIENAWKAENWDPEHLVRLYKARARATSWRSPTTTTISTPTTANTTPGTRCASARSATSSAPGRRSRAQRAALRGQQPQRACLALVADRLRL
jgi:hypothetical protein